MANTGQGLQLRGTLHGAPAHIGMYYVPAGDATALYKGDVVKLTASAGTMNASYQGMVANTLQGITRAATGDKLLGVIVGFLPDPLYLFTDHYRTASTARVALVCDDPFAIWAVQEDGVSGAVTAAQIGAMYNIPLNVAAGSTYTGVSGTMVTSASVTQSASDCKIIGVDQTPGNVGAQTNGAVLLVTLLAPAILATASEA